MLSCTWPGGVPTLSLIPHTDPPSFSAAAQAFASTHYAHAPRNAHTHETANAVTTASDDVGQKVSRESLRIDQGHGARTSRADATAGRKSKAVGNYADVGQGVSQASPGQGARGWSRGEHADVGHGAGQDNPGQHVGSDPAMIIAGKEHLASSSADAQALTGPEVLNHDADLEQAGNPQQVSSAALALPQAPLAAKADALPKLHTHAQTPSDGDKPSNAVLLKQDHPAQGVPAEPYDAAGDTTTSSNMVTGSPAGRRLAARDSGTKLDSKAARVPSSSEPQQADHGGGGATGRQTADASACELLVFEDR